MCRKAVAKFCFMQIPALARLAQFELIKLNLSSKFNKFNATICSRQVKHCKFGRVLASKVAAARVPKCLLAKGFQLGNLITSANVDFESGTLTSSCNNSLSKKAYLIEVVRRSYPLSSNPREAEIWQSFLWPQSSVVPRPCRHRNRWHCPVCVCFREKGFKEKAH